MSVDSDGVVEWSARPADRPSWWVRLIGFAGGGATLALGGGLALAGDDVGVGLAVLAFALAGVAALVRSTRRRTYAVVESGLVRDERVVPWSAFESYEETPEAVVIYRARRFRGAVRLDRDDLEDVDRVREALDDHLPER